MSSGRGRTAVALVTVVAGAALLTACGGSSKPSYCASIDSLKSSIKAVPSTKIVQEGTNALKAALTKVEEDAKAVVSSAKSDFPNETSALSSSVNALASSATALTSTPSAAAVAQTVSDAAAVSTAAKNLASATSSKCS
jgi:hypothetical protein